MRFTFVDDVIPYADSSLADGVYLIDSPGSIIQLIFINRPMPQSYFNEIKSSGHRVIMAGPMGKQPDNRCYYSYLLRNEAA